MKKIVFVKLLIILGCLVSGGLICGVAAAGFNIKYYEPVNEYNYQAVAAEPGPVFWDESTPKDSPIVISMMGDVLLASGVAAAIERYGPDFPWRHTSGLISDSDLAIANLECAVSGRGEPEPDKAFTFRADPGVLSGAYKAGIDIFTLANNHVRDYGQTAMTDTIGFLKQYGIMHSGAGFSEREAAAPAIAEINGISIAVLAFSRVIPNILWAAAPDRPGVASGFNHNLMLESIKSAKKDACLVIVSMHWGEELCFSPHPQDVTLAHMLIDAGADIVFGHHPHVVQGIELYEGKIIAYSLGNFIFSPGSQEGKKGAVLQAIFNGKDFTAKIIPVYINGDTTTLLPEKERRAALSRFNELTKAFGTAADSNGIIYSIP